MEIIGLILLLIVASIICYFLDLHETGWSWIRRFFNIPNETSMLAEFKERYAQISQNRKDAKVEKRSKQSLEQWKKKELAEKSLGQWKKHREKQREKQHPTYNLEYSNGRLSSNPRVGSREWLNLPEIQRQLKGMQKLVDGLDDLNNTKPPPPPNPPRVGSPAVPKAIGPKLATLTLNSEKYAKAKIVKSSGTSITAVRTKDNYTDDPGPR